MQANDSHVTSELETSYSPLQLQLQKGEIPVSILSSCFFNMRVIGVDIDGLTDVQSLWEFLRGFAHFSPDVLEFMEQFAYFSPKSSKFCRLADFPYFESFLKEILRRIKEYGPLDSFVYKFMMAKVYDSVLKKNVDHQFEYYQIQQEVDGNLKTVAESMKDVTGPNVVY